MAATSPACDSESAGMPAGIPTEGALAFLRALAAREGDYASYNSPYGQVHFFNHPDQVREFLMNRNFMRPPMMKALLGDGLLTSEGSLWKQQRRMMQPAFHLPCVHALLPGIHAALRDFIPRWEQAAETGDIIDVASSMRRVTLDVILRCMFDARFDQELETMGAALTVLIRDLGQLTGTMLNQPYAVTPARNAAFQQALKTVDELIFEIIRRHQALPPGEARSMNILNLLMQGRMVDSGAGLPDKLIRDEVASMIVGGHETLANVLSWTWEVLALRPDLSARLHAEVDALSKDRPLTHHDLARLPMAVNLFKESLRLYPPVWFMVRTPLANCELGGVTLPAGAQVMISPYTLHRHTDFWPDPERFDPDRFLPEAEAQRHKSAWMPFAAGRHLCLGLPLAMLEGPLILAALAQRFAVQPHSESATALVADPLITLRQRNGLQAQVVSRSPHSQSGSSTASV